MDLAQILIERGLDARRLDDIARRSVERGSAFILEVVSAGLIEEEVVADLAARALGTVLVAVEHGELDEESVRLVPRRIASRYLVLPVARDERGERLRVAFADPFDAEALEAVRRATGLEIEPLVATVSSIMGAIERAYRGDTKVVHRGELGGREAVVLRSDTALRSDKVRGTAPVEARESTATRELPAESTKRVERAFAAESTQRLDRTTEADAVATAPLHRLEDDASVDQRLEALLLTLVDAGVIVRTDYLDALRRLMGR